MTKTIRVLLADDHAMLRKGVAALLGAEPDIIIVGEADDGEQAIDEVRALKPDVVVMDVSMPGLSGIDATRQIRTDSPDSKVVALSIHAARHFVDDMLDAGAAGYLLKESAPEELVQGIRAVMRGEMYLSSAIATTVVSAYVEAMDKARGPAGADAEPDILQTKLHRPSPPQDLVPRTRQLNLLDAGRVKPLTLVAAPAGYGKSVLVSSWLDRTDWRSTWLSLDQSDGDLRRFLSYLIAAVRRIFAGACARSAELADANDLPPLAVVATTLANELDALEKPFFLVLDDYHRIHVTSPVNELIDPLLARPPLPLHLVIISRRDPPLQLGTLRAKDQVNELRMQDLRFSRDEMLSLLQKHTALAPSEDELASLEQELEGWAVGLREQPELLLLRAWRHYYHLEVAAILPVLDRIDDLMAEDAATHEFSGEVSMFRGFCALFQNQNTASLKHIQHALGRIALTEAEFRGQTEILFGLAGQIEGQKERGTRMLIRWLSATPLEPLREACLLWTLACAAYIAADPREAQRYIPQGRKVSRSHPGGANFLAWFDYFEGLIHLQRGDPDAAIRFLEQAGTRKYFHFTRAAADACSALVVAFQASGLPDRAKEALRSLREFTDYLGPGFSDIADACAARLALMQGRSDIAIGWLANSAPPVELMLCWFECPAISWCRALIAEGSADSLSDAQARLGEYVKQNDASHNDLHFIELLTLQAMAYQQLGKRQDALAALQRALAVAQPGGLVFPFLELGQPIDEMLGSLTDTNDLSDFVSHLHCRFRKRNNQAPGAAATTGIRGGATSATEQFTRRELEILGLLAQRLQNKEIAAELFVSPETVKTHLKNLYQKLSVSNRRDAAAKSTVILAELKISQGDRT